MLRLVGSDFTQIYILVAWEKTSNTTQFLKLRKFQLNGPKVYVWIDFIDPGMDATLRWYGCFQKALIEAVKSAMKEIG